MRQLCRSTKEMYVRQPGSAPDETRVPQSGDKTRFPALTGRDRSIAKNGFERNRAVEATGGPAIGGQWRTRV
jgi:hypothetical protein